MTGNGRDFSEGIKPARCGKCSAGGSGAFEEQRFDVLAFGEILIDFTFKGFNDAGMRLFSQNPGGGFLQQSHLDATVILRIGVLHCS